MVTFPAVVDSSENVEKILPDLKARGVQAVFRYYALELQAELPTKIVTPRERDAIFGAGLSLGVVFQFHNDRITTFTRDRGESDAAKALDYGRDVIRQPPGTTIYFGVDSDFAKPAELAAVAAYFQAVNEAFEKAGSPYAVGVYGSGLSCSTLEAAGLATRFWLAKSTGYSGTQRTFNLRSWHLYQSMLEVPVGRGAVDTNWLNGQAGPPGTFDAHGPTVPAEPAAISNERRFVVRNATAYEKPDLASRPAALLRVRENVIVVQEEKKWSTIRTRESGSPDLYIHSDQLGMIDQMP
jgi:hypothetical protein